MSSQLKSWFFSTIRGINSRGKYVNFNDGSEPDQVTFSSLMDTTVLKKVGSTYQDQADYVAVNAESNDKFTTADNLPIVENSVDGSITLDITAATTNSEKIKYKINPHFVSDIDQISPDRDTNVFVNPNNLPKVAVEIVGTPIAGQSPLVVGNTITSELDIVNFYETFKLKLNVLTSSFISHSGVLLSTVLNTLRADVDAKVSDAELASEVSILNSSILTKATKVTPSIGLNGNGTKVTVNAEGVVTNINRANASDLKNDSSVAGSTIKDALNNLNSSLTGDLIATVVPNISTEISDFNAIAGTKHFVDTSAGNIICSLPAVIDSASGDLIMVYKSTSDTNTITVVDTHLSFVLLQHKDNALFHFSDDRWSFVGVTPDSSFIKDLVFLTSADTVLQIDKINWVTPTANHSIALPVADISLLGKVLIVNNRTAYQLTVTGSNAPIILKGIDSIVGIACVTNGVDYGWENFSYYNKGDFDLISQTVTDGITTKSPSENAVFDAVYAKGLINGTIWVNAYTALGNFNLSIDKYNNVGYTDSEGAISVILPTFNSAMSGKTIIVEPHRFNDGLTTVNISIPGLQKDGGGGAGTYTEVITKMGQIVTIQANYYGWHVIGHTNQVPDLSTYALLTSSITNGDTIHSPDGNAVFDALALKLDLSGGNANQDIDIGNFSLNAKHVKINGTGGAGHIGLKHQSADITATGSESSIGANSVGDPVWKNDGGAIDKLELQSNKTSTVTGNEASTSKYLTVKGVYDWAVGLFAPKSSPTFTGTITTPDIVVSNATGSTPAFFDAVDKLITTTAQLWGTWVQTWGSKATPVDADIIGFYNSASTFVGVKSTLLNLWTAYLLPKIQALGYLSGSGLTTNRITKWDGTKLVNANSVDDGVTISSTINRTFTSDTSPVNQSSKFVFTGANTSASANSFIKVALDLQVSPFAMGANAKGMLFLDGSSSGAGNSNYPQLYINSGGDIIDTKKSLVNAIRIYHRSLDDINNFLWNSPAVIIDAIKLRPEAIPVTEGALGVHAITSQNADNYVSRINNTGNQGNNPVHYYAKSYRADAWGFYHNKDAGANSGIFSMNFNHVKANVTTVNNGFGYLIRNQIANSNLSTLANLDEQYIAQDFGLSTIHVAKRYFTGGGYVMGLYAGGVIIGNTTALPNASAALDIVSTTKGFLPPRMTAAQMTAIASPATGLIVYQTDGTAGLYQYNGTAWVGFASMSGLSANYTPYWDGTKLINSDLYRVSGAGQTGGIATRSARLFQALNSEANTENALGVYKQINTNIYDAQVIYSHSRGLNISANYAPAGSASLSSYALKVDNNTTNGSYTAWLQATDKTLAEAQLTAVNSGTIIIRRDGTISSATPPVNYNTGFYFEIRPSTDLTYNKYGNFYLALIDVANKKSGFQFIVNFNKRMTLHEDGGLLIGTGAVPNASAALDVDSTTKGFLAPRMTATQRVAIVSPVAGLLVYQTDVHAGYWYHDGTIWQDLSQPRAGTTASSATPTINTDVTDYYEITGQTVDITSFTTNLTGTPVRGQKLWIDITGTAAIAITWGASFEASTIALPTTTVTTEKLSVEFIWNVTTSKWRCVRAV